jgi:hypothetical protein
LNDNYLASSRMVRADGGVARFYHNVVDTTQATTQSDLFDPSREGAPLGGAGPEQTACGSTAFGNTVWYDFSPEVFGGVEIIAAGFDTVVTVYRFDARTALTTAVVTCQNNSAGASEDVLLPRVQRGVSYTVQVGGAAIPAGFAGGPLDFTFRFFADRDRDGVLDETPDRCPDLPGIQAAGGCPPTLAAAARLAWAVTGNGLRLTRASVVHVPRGSRIVARCRRCGASQTVHVRGSQNAARLSRFLGRTLPAGAVIQISVTHPRSGSGRYRFGAIGTYLRYRVRATDLGPVTTRCLKPGSNTPRRRCT